MTREGRDWTAKLRMQRDALAALEVENAWLDGEAVVLASTGCPISRRCRTHSARAVRTR